jgi:hypothetical protein
MAFDYRYLIDRSVLDVLKQILTDIQNNGLIGDQSFYISFCTDFEGVILSKPVAQRYPREITIVLQHQFRRLRVLDEKFTVNITFSGVAENIEVPFSAITSFLDPVANFGFQFALPNRSSKNKSHVVNKADIIPSRTKFIESKTGTINKEAKVVVLDKFRKKREEENKTS